MDRTSATKKGLRPRSLARTRNPTRARTRNRTRARMMRTPTSRNPSTDLARNKRCMVMRARPGGLLRGRPEARCAPINHQFSTLDPEPQTLNPKPYRSAGAFRPETRELERGGRRERGGLLLGLLSLMTLGCSVHAKNGVSNLALFYFNCMMKWRACSP